MTRDDGIFDAALFEVDIYIMGELTPVAVGKMDRGLRMAVTAEIEGADVEAGREEVDHGVPSARVEAGGVEQEDG